MAETIVLDATAVATGRTQLDITSYVAAAGPNWGDAEITAYMADQQIGSTTVDYRLPNRQISIPLSLRALGATTFSTIRSSIQQKVGRFQAEGGWIMRQVGSTPLYADVVNATLHLGGAWLAAYRDIDIDAVLTLECIPDWYGDEITLSDHVETTLPHLLFTEATVNGNYPGRVRLVVDNDQATDQRGLLWGFRSKNYGTAATQALFYEAESLIKVNGAANAALSGASGGTAVTISSPPNGVWVPMLAMQMTAGSAWFTHAGSYRVWGRCYSAAATPSYRLQWGPATMATPITNAGVALAGTANFYMLDLGGIRIDAPPVGTNQWQGAIQTMVQGTADVASIDCIYFQPLDEAAGKVTASSVSPVSSIAAERPPVTVADDSLSGTVAWTNPTNAAANDNSYATISLTAGQTSHYLKATNFFAIPSGATIRGIEMRVFHKFATSGAWNWFRNPRLVKAGTIQTGFTYTTAQSLNYGPDMLVLYGGPTDLWGTTWAASDINNTGFGCAVQFIDTSSAAAILFSVNFLEMVVWYTLATGFTVSPDAVAYASQSIELRSDGMFREDPTGSVFGPVSTVLGDLPRIPPSGLEARTVQTFLKMTRGDFDQQPDSAIDDISAKITYRPSYLITP